MRLRKHGAVVAADEEIFKSVGSGKVDEVAVDVEIFGAAGKPVLERICWNFRFKGSEIFFIAAGKSLNFSLVLEGGVLENFGAVLPVVFGFSSRPVIIGRAHNRAESENRRVGIIFVERLKIFRAGENFGFAETVLARADKAAVNHGVGGNNNRVGVGSVFI